jgi:hypothetical protein
MANNLQEALWLHVAQFIKINENKPKLFVANHFIVKGVKRFLQIFNSLKNQSFLKDIFYG